MKCDKFIELISNYIENDITEEEKVAFKAHLEICKECKEEFESVKNALQVLSSIEEEEIPEGFKKDIHNRLLLESERINKNKLFKSKIVSFTKRGGAIAATIAVGIFTIFFINNSFYGAKADKSVATPNMATASMENAYTKSNSTEAPKTYGKSALEDNKSDTQGAPKEESASEEKLTITAMADKNLKTAGNVAPSVEPKVEVTPTPVPEVSSSINAIVAMASEAPVTEDKQRSVISSFSAVDQYGNEHKNDEITIKTKDTKDAKTKIESKVSLLKGKIENISEGDNNTFTLDIYLEVSKKTEFIDYLNNVFKKENISVVTASTTQNLEFVKIVINITN